MIVAMAKKPGPKPKPTGNVNVNIKADLHNAMIRFINETTPAPSKTSTVEAAIQEFLKAKGFWPPKEAK